MSLTSYIFMPVKFKCFYREYRDREFRILDVGCGNHSPRETKKSFPKCEYHGIDKGVYNNDDEDFALMKKFYDIDLAQDAPKLDAVPDGYFDVVVFSHVIEHLENGAEVLRNLARKVKTGGKIYVEFPSLRSLALPSMKGTLNFYDDSSHVRIFQPREIEDILGRERFEIIKSGPRRDVLRIVLTPLAVFYSLFKFGRVKAAVLWDLTGFADIVYARKL